MSLICHRVFWRATTLSALTFYRKLHILFKIGLLIDVLPWPFRRSLRIFRYWLSEPFQKFSLPHYVCLTMTQMAMVIWYFCPFTRENQTSARSNRFDRKGRFRLSSLLWHNTHTLGQCSAYVPFSSRQYQSINNTILNIFSKSHKEKIFHVNRLYSLNSIRVWN